MTAAQVRHRLHVLQDVKHGGGMHLPPGSSTFCPGRFLIIQVGQISQHLILPQQHLCLQGVHNVTSCGVHRLGCTSPRQGSALLLTSKAWLQS